MRRKEPRLAILDPCKMIGPKVSNTTAQTDRATKPTTKSTITCQGKAVKRIAIGRSERADFQMTGLDLLESTWTWKVLENAKCGVLFHDAS